MSFLGGNKGILRLGAAVVDVAISKDIKQSVQFNALPGSDPLMGRENFDAVISAMCHRILSEQPAAGARLFMQMATDHRA